MKKTFVKKLCAVIAFAVAFLYFIPGKVLAFTPPEPKGYVVDLANKLSQEEVQKLNAKISSLKKEIANEMAALILPSLDGESIEDVAYATFNSWKIGKAGHDNGVLVVIAVKDRKSRIETGKGIGGEITDLQASDILKKNLNPFLKNGDFYGGLDSTFSELNRLLESRKQVTLPVAPVKNANNSAANDAGLTGVLIGAAIFISIFIGLYLLSKRHEKRVNKVFSDLYTDRSLYTHNIPTSRQQIAKPNSVENFIKYKKVEAVYPEYKQSPLSTFDSSRKHSYTTKTAPVLTTPPIKKVASVRYDDPYYERSSYNKKDSSSDVVETLSAISAIASSFSSSREDSPSSNRSSSNNSSSSWFSDSSSPSDSGSFGGGESGGGGASGDY